VLDPDEPIFDATSPAVTLKLTDYQSQGQTIESVIVDITTSNGQKLSHFNLYVALSRSSGRNTIRILRDFDEKLFAQSLDPDLLTDDERLEGLDAETKVSQ
jgi:ATP-dependent exoDNAse (exonuclease V) alpha subunit